MSQAQNPPNTPQVASPQVSGQPHVNDTLYISFSAEVSQHTTETLIAVVADGVQKGMKTIYLLLSTPGGGVMQGMTIYNVLRSLPIKLITHNVGNVDSIGNTIFLAGEERFACQHSTFMFHGVGFDIVSPTRFEEKMLRERTNSIMADQARIGSVLSERTKLKTDDIRNLFLESVTKDPAYALNAGIIHGIRDVKVPNGAPFVQLVFKR